MVHRQPLFVLPEGVETRWSSPENPTAQKGFGGQAKGGRKGSPYVPLPAGASHVIAEEAGTSGTVWRIWVTISDQSPKMLRGMRIDCYWDGANRPAVSAPLGDFFGMGLGRLTRFESALFSSPEGRSFNCYVPMPFRKGMRIVVTNETDSEQGHLFYDVDYTVGDPHADDVLYLHAHFRRENPTRLQHDYAFLPRVSGKGRFLGINVGVIVNHQDYSSAWWGEGECKIFLDGDVTYPSLCGTGTEDYIGTGWGQGQYDHLYQGCHVADKEKMHYCFYRYHVPDPIYFRESIRVTMQQIGCWDPASRRALAQSSQSIYHANAGLAPVDFEADQRDYGLFERQDDWSSCVYFYLNRPENALPPLDPIGQRIVGLEES